MLAWNISNQEESEDSEGIVTISSEEEDTEENKDITPKCRCKGKGHRTKKQAIECISKARWEKDMKEWSPHIEALNKAIYRENHKKDGAGNDYGKRPAELMRKEAEEAEKEKEDPEAVKPKTEVCHTDIYYQEAVKQEKSEGPPAFRYTYLAEEDDWANFLSSPEDIVRSIFNKVSREAEKKATQSKTQMIRSISRAFQETRHREEVTRKGYGRMKDYDAGRRVVKKANEKFEEWEEARTRQGRLTIKGGVVSVEVIEHRPGPNTACHGCGAVPDHRLKRCSRFRTTWYCNVNCQRRDWRRHKTHCNSVHNPSHNPSTIML